MDIWTIVVSVIAATVIVFLLNVIHKWFKVSRLAKEVKDSVKAIELIRTKYPTIPEYEADIDLELMNQGASSELIKAVLGDGYDEAVDKAYAQGEQPSHFVDRWLYSVMAPQRWDHIDSALTYYYVIVHILLDNRIRPSNVLAQFGNAERFQTVIETSLANKIAPEDVVLKYFPNCSV